MKSFISNTKNVKIKTDSGYYDFDGIAFNGVQDLYKVSFIDGTFIEATKDHKFHTESNEIQAIALSPGMEVITISGPKKIKDVVKIRNDNVYDLINTGPNHRFYANGVLVSNCEFVSSDQTLIDGLVLKNLTSSPEIFTIDKIKWYAEPKANHIYGIGWDPALGTGGDSAAIEVFDFTDMEQVAEWSDALTPCSKQVEVLLKILYYLYQELYEDPNQEGEPELYWSVENNSVGDSALTAIEYTGIEQFPGYFLSEKIGGRKGYCTTNKSKLSSCSQFKRLVETNKLTIHSKQMVREMKNFVAKGSSFEAKYGEHDDLIMATLMVIRILQRVHNWEESLEDKLSTDINVDDIVIEPMPPIF